MRVHRGFESLAPDHFRRPVASIGVFDGIHLGHRAVIDVNRDLARELDGESVLVTFDTHPRLVVRGRAPRAITSVAHRLVLLERSGLDHAVVLPFSDEIMGMTADEFATRVFERGMGVSGIVLGFDSRFGKGRQGDIDFVKSWASDPARQREIVVRSAPPVLIEGRPISSSVIRDAIAAGEHDQAQALLGRPVAVYGTVVPGSGRGEEIGFGTANIDLAGELSPPNGVYAAWARFKGRWRAALVNIGSRPTFEDEGAEVAVEVHVPGISEKLYGEEMEVQFVQRIRDEQRFPNVEALVAQIEKDCEELKRIVGEVNDPPPHP
jgi:riboflavin kinase/FMN adenylyltransferase